jgi:hypothetical protein
MANDLEGSGPDVCPVGLTSDGEHCLTLFGEVQSGVVRPATSASARRD